MAGSRIRGIGRWLLPLLLANFVQAQPAGSPALRHRILDLRSLGAVGLQVSAEEEGKPLYPGRVHFIDGSTLAISFPIFNPVVALSTREHPTGGSILLHTVLLDLQRFQVTSERSWGNAAKTVLIPFGDRFAVASDGQAQVFSRDWKQLDTYRYRAPVAIRYLASPSGKTLFYTSPTADQAAAKEMVEVLPNGMRKSAYVFTADSEGYDAASDSKFAFVRHTNRGIKLFVAPLDAFRTKPLALQPLPYDPEERCIKPHFVSDDLLVFGGECKHLSLVSATGKLRFRSKLAWSSELFGFVSSRDQTRFAFIVRDVDTEPWRGERPATVYRARTLDVYETASLAKLFEVPIPQPLGSTYSMDLALSPDGSSVALLVGWRVVVYRVSPSGG